MAYTTGYSPRDNGFGKKVAGAFSAVFAHFVALIDAYGEARSRVDQVQRLQAMSDEALAKRGIKRDQIVHHVFRDQFYI